MKIKSLVLVAATALSAPVMAQTVLKIGYATTQASHYGVGSTVFCDESKKELKAATSASSSPAAPWGVSAR